MKCDSSGVTEHHGGVSVFKDDSSGEADFSSFDLQTSQLVVLVYDLYLPYQIFSLTFNSLLVFGRI